MSPLLLNEDPFEISSNQQFKVKHPRPMTQNLRGRTKNRPILFSQEESRVFNPSTNTGSNYPLAGAYQTNRVKSTNRIQTFYKKEQANQEEGVISGIMKSFTGLNTTKNSLKSAHGRSGPRETYKAGASTRMSSQDERQRPNLSFNNSKARKYATRASNKR